LLKYLVLLVDGHLNPLRLGLSSEASGLAVKPLQVVCPQKFANARKLKRMDGAKVENSQVQKTRELVERGQSEN
jgi:hypothetical protein